MRYELPSLAALVAFETVARRLSFARAAGELNLTPSAVSHQIAKLEAFLGFLLFERTPRGITVSDAGMGKILATLERYGDLTNLEIVRFSGLSVNTVKNRGVLQASG